MRFLDVCSHRSVNDEARRVFELFTSVIPYAAEGALELLLRDPLCVIIGVAVEVRRIQTI